MHIYLILEKKKNFLPKKKLTSFIDEEDTLNLTYFMTAELYLDYSREEGLIQF